MGKAIAAVMCSAAVAFAAYSVTYKVTPWSVALLVFCVMLNTYTLVSLLITQAKD